MNHSRLCLPSAELGLVLIWALNTQVKGSECLTQDASLSSGMDTQTCDWRGNSAGEGSEERPVCENQKSKQKGPRHAGRSEHAKSTICRKEGRATACMHAGWSWARKANLASFMCESVFQPLVSWHLHSTLNPAHCSEEFSVLADWPVLI